MPLADVAGRKVYYEIHGDAPGNPLVLVMGMAGSCKGWLALQVPEFSQHHRTVIFECRAMVSADAEALAAQQMRLMARYQPEGGFRPVSPEHPIYRGALATIRAIRLEIQSTRVKFKLAQNRPPQVRANLVRELRKRGRRNDERAADLLAWTIEHESTRTRKPD